MKRIILSIIFLLFFKVNTYATDACIKFIPRETKFIGEVVFASNLRDFPCTSKSNILGISSKGKTYTIVSEVDGWYQIQFDTSSKYWIWDQSIKNIGEIELKKEKYILTAKDNILINKFVSRIKKVIDIKGLGFKKGIIIKITEIINNGNYSLRLITLLEEIKNRVNDIGIEKIEEKKEVIIEKIIENNDGNIEIEDKINIGKVNDTWLGWNNKVRKDLGKNNYIFDNKLSYSALEWSKIAENRGKITHKRDSGDDYYDYNKITSWLKNNGVSCKNIYGVTHTENIGYGKFVCKDSECTDELITSIKRTFDFYMSEKNDSYQPHYKSLISDYFTKIGMGITYKELNIGYYEYYLTVHYCTELY